MRWPGLPVPSEPAGSLAPGPSPPTPGVVDSVRPDLVAGALSTTVTLDRPGTLLLSVAYDPDWHASVDGRPVQTELLAPALIGVQIGAGPPCGGVPLPGFCLVPRTVGLRRAWPGRTGHGGTQETLRGMLRTGVARRNG